MLDQRGIRRRADLGHQHRLGLQGNPPTPSGSRGGQHPARLLAPPSPPLERADTDAEEAGRLGLGKAGVNGSQQPFAEVGRVLLHRHSLAQGQLLRNLL